MQHALSRAIFFVDTNFFVQCEPAEALDWRLVTAADVVEVMVSRPVQAEIDRQKSKSGGRLGKKARSTSSVFRTALKAADERITIRAANPKVLLQLRVSLRSDPDFSDQLDFTERDDQLVGIAATFAKRNPDMDVCLLTHDIGPLLSAKNVGLPAKEIPEEWLLQPESDEYERALANAQRELQRYQKAEPSFQISVAGTALNNELTFDYHASLAEEEISELMALLQADHPIAEDFGPSELSERPTTITTVSSAFARETFEPASDESKRAYRDQHYPRWLEKCESIFRSSHLALNERIPWPEIIIDIANIGSRPADDSLVLLKAEGDFLISVPPQRLVDEDDEEDDDTEQTAHQYVLELPRPPVPPRGTWRKVPTAIDRIREGLARSMHLNPSRAAGLDYLSEPRFIAKRDPNVFYFKDGRPGIPVTSVSHECAQWRHQRPGETFSCNILPTKLHGNNSGVLKIEVHANNVATPIEKRVPLRMAISEATTFEFAHWMVRKLRRS